MGPGVCATVVLVAGADATKEELTAFTAERLAYFKVPTRWRLTRDLLPRNSTGKIVRRHPGHGLREP